MLEFTRDQVLNEPVGDRLNALVFIHVFQKKDDMIDCTDDTDEIIFKHAKYFKDYTADMNAAREAEKHAVKSFGVQYILKLAEVVFEKLFCTYDDVLEYADHNSERLLSLIGATPVQRSKAALLTVLDSQL